MEDLSGAAGIESLPFEDRGLAWLQAVTGVCSELAVRLKECHYDDGDGASVLEESCCSGDAGAGESLPLRETMVRVGHWSGGESKLESRSPLATLKSGARSGAEAVDRDPRAKPHVEEWLRQQQELTASQLTSTTTFGSEQKNNTIGNKISLCCHRKDSTVSNWQFNRNTQHIRAYFTGRPRS